MGRLDEMEREEVGDWEGERDEVRREGEREQRKRRESKERGEEKER